MSVRHLLKWSSALPYLPTLEGSRRLDHWSMQITPKAETCLTKFSRVTSLYFFEVFSWRALLQWTAFNIFIYLSTSSPCMLGPWKPLHFPLRNQDSSTRQNNYCKVTFHLSTDAVQINFQYCFIPCRNRASWAGIMSPMLGLTRAKLTVLKDSKLYAQIAKATPLFSQIFSLCLLTYNIVTRDITS